ncbi:hypothetical protein QBC38DRAFT_252579 [Podospora fimiseda]|uniref:Uncharacterized protein n=1 Tax=Podospora fimiseda TaxID=252190 RepID=A0AAN7GZH9_9PEZI|nr:hypothetical protein QBC38DRAFT_252579 [Podospora fimiseda]
MSNSPQPPAPSALGDVTNLPTERDLDPKFFEIPALREKHAAEKRSQEEAYQAARKAAEDDYQKQALQYDQIDLASEVKESMKNILRDNCRLKIRELDQKFKDEKAALEKRHNEEENKAWTAIIGLPSSVKDLNLNSSSPRASTQRTPLPSGSAPKDAAARVSGSSGMRRSLPLAPRAPPTGQVVYSSTVQHSNATMQSSRQNENRPVSQTATPPISFYPPPHLAGPRPPPLHEYARQIPPSQHVASYSHQYLPTQQFPTLMSQATALAPAGERDLRAPSSMTWPHSSAAHHNSPHPSHAHPGLAAPTLAPMMAKPTQQPPAHLQYQQQMQQPQQSHAPQQRHPLPGFPPILAAPGGPMPGQMEESAKRKAETLAQAVSSETAAKRPRQSHHGGTSDVMDQQPPRTVTFDEVYADGKAEYQHMIIQFPEGGPFYILRCDEHGVHFGEHPLRGAAKHLASAQHGRMSKEHSKAVETLGHRVLGCTIDLMEKNNAKVLESFNSGYKPFNANQLSKTKRALKGYGDKPATPAASPAGTPMRRKPPTDPIWNPTAPGLYVGFCVPDQKQYPAIVLPWNEPTLESAGIGMTLAETGILAQPDGLPKCYIYEKDGEKITAIKGWAEGYEDRGPLCKRREFAVIFIDNAELRNWQIGWIQAKHLQKFELERPVPEDLPFFNEAREYYARSIKHFDSYKALHEALRHNMYAQRQQTVLEQTAQMREAQSGNKEATADSTPRHPIPSHPRYEEDSEMVDVTGSDAESDRASSTKSFPNSDEDVEMANTDSRRTSVSNPNRDDTPKDASAPPGPVVQTIAAQALARSSGFTAINSRSTASSVEPASRQPSVERKRVEKIYASSRRRDQGPLASSAASEKSKHDTLSPSPAPSTVVRRPSPASLENILSESPREVPSVESDNQNAETPSIIAPKPTTSINVVTGLGISNALRVERAESAPAPQPKKLSAEEEERARSASLTPASASTPATPALGVNGLAGLHSLSSVQPLPSQYPTPLPSATESTQSRTPLPTMSFSRPAEMTPAASPLGTPIISALNSRANSPAVASFVSAKLDSTPGPASGSSAEQEAFEVSLICVGEEVVFDSADGKVVSLVEDSKTGVFRAAEGSSEAVGSLEINPQKVKTAIRVLGDSGATCLVKVVFDKTVDEESGKIMELVFETLKQGNKLSGKVLAAKFCRRLKSWNKDVECPIA